MIVTVCYRTWPVMELEWAELEGDCRITYGQEITCKIHRDMFIESEQK